MKQFLLILVLFAGTCFGQQKDFNPFESIGKPGKILTLSKGKYTEVHINDSLQRIGSVIVNMSSGMIYDILETDTLYNESNLDPTIITRWYSPDPVVKHHESPYASMANNPIWCIDPNGADSALAAGSSTWQWSVEAGDTYNSISARTGVPVGDLRYFNQDLVKDDTKIPTFGQSGQLLHLSDPTCPGSSSSAGITVPDGTINVNEYTNYLLETQIYLTFTPGTGVNASDFIWFQTFETNDPLNDGDNGPDRAFTPAPVFQTDNVAGYNLYNSQVKTNNERIAANARSPYAKRRLLALPFSQHVPINPINANVVGFADTPWRNITNNGQQIQWNGTLMLCKKVDGNYIIYKTFSYSWTQVMGDKSQAPLIYQDTNPAAGSDASNQVNSFLNK